MRPLLLMDVSLRDDFNYPSLTPRQLSKLAKSGHSFHYPSVIQAEPIPPTTESNVLYMLWDGVFLSQYFNTQRPAIEPKDYLTLLLQLHWAVMVAGELGGIRHSDCHIGNVVVRPAPPGTRWRMRMAIQLLATSLLAKQLSATHNSEGGATHNSEDGATHNSVDVELVVEFDTPFFVSVIDWASISSADIYRPLPPSILMQVDSPRCSRTSSRGSGADGSRLTSLFVPGVLVTELIASVQDLVGAKAMNDATAHYTLTQLCGETSQHGATGW
jgi:hypothetical protein